VARSATAQTLGEIRTAFLQKLKDHYGQPQAQSNLPTRSKVDAILDTIVLHRLSQEEAAGATPSFDEVRSSDYRAANFDSIRDQPGIVVELGGDVFNAIVNQLAKAGGHVLVSRGRLTPWGGRRVLRASEMYDWLGFLRPSLTRKKLENALEDLEENDRYIEIESTDMPLVGPMIFETLVEREGRHPSGYPKVTILLGRGADRDKWVGYATGPHGIFPVIALRGPTPPAPEPPGQSVTLDEPVIETEGLSIQIAPHPSRTDGQYLVVNGQPRYFVANDLSKVYSVADPNTPQEAFTKVTDFSKAALLTGIAGATKRLMRLHPPQRIRQLPPGGAALVIPEVEFMMEYTEHFVILRINGERAYRLNRSDAGDLVAIKDGKYPGDVVFGTLVTYFNGICVIRFPILAGFNRHTLFAYLPSQLRQAGEEGETRFDLSLLADLALLAASLTSLGILAVLSLMTGAYAFKARIEKRLGFKFQCPVIFADNALPPGFSVGGTRVLFRSLIRPLQNRFVSAGA
jgi:hypothetical protein